MRTACASPRRPGLGRIPSNAGRLAPAMADPRAHRRRPDDRLRAAAMRPRSSSSTARHQAALYRFVRRLLGTALSAQTDEVFQDTWLRVVHSRERWQPQGATFRTWLFTLAHHRVIDLLRRSGREVSVDAFEKRGRRALAAGSRPRGSTGRRRQRPRRRATSSPSGVAPARSCSSAWSSCPCRSAVPSSFTMTTGWRSTRSRAPSRSASRPRRRACAMR